jgi:hypothetical protein
MIEPGIHETARRRHDDLLAGAERHRLSRIVRAGKTRRQTFRPLVQRLNVGQLRRRIRSVEI